MISNRGRVGIVFFIIAISLIAIIFCINRNRNDCYRQGGYTEGFFYYDKLLGYKPKPNTKVSSILKFKGETIYCVTYSIDEYSRRITPVGGRSDRNKFILFFGCSFTFGEGVKSNETLPFFTGEYAIFHKPYNYGFCGYGPQEMLAKLQDGSLRNEIKESTGVLVYTFIDEHVRRAIGSMRCVSEWGANMPYYFIAADGQLVRNGSFSSGRPKAYSLYKKLSNNPVVKNLNLDLPLCVTKKDIELVCKILGEARVVFKKQYENSDFYVVFYPKSRYAKLMIPLLEKAGVKCLDYNNIFYHSDVQAYYKKNCIISPYDCHPNGKAYEIIAKKLVEDIFSNIYQSN